MKTTSIILSFCFASQAVAQIAEFAPLGAKWWYDQIQAFEPQNSYWLYESEKDTTIDGKVFRKILRSEISSLTGSINVADPIYILQEDAKLYITFNVADTAEEYFDFTAEVGDSIRTITLYGTLDHAISVVDSISIVNFAGVDVKAYYLHNIELSDEYLVGFTSVFYETIGSAAYFFPWDGLIDPPEGGNLRCYEDADLGLIKFTGDAPCEYVVPVEDEENKIFQLYPNPANYVLNIHFNASTDIQLTIIDILGKQFYPEIVNVNVNNVGFDILSLPSGIYFATVYSDDRIIGTQKFVKQ